MPGETVGGRPIYLAFDRKAWLTHSGHYLDNGDLVETKGLVWAASILLAEGKLEGAPVEREVRGEMKAVYEIRVDTKTLKTLVDTFYARRDLSPAKIRQILASVKEDIRSLASQHPSESVLDSDHFMAEAEDLVSYGDESRDPKLYRLAADCAKNALAEMLYAICLFLSRDIDVASAELPTEISNSIFNENTKWLTAGGYEGIFGLSRVLKAAEFAAGRAKQEAKAKDLGLEAYRHPVEAGTGRRGVHFERRKRSFLPPTNGV